MPERTTRTSHEAGTHAAACLDSTLEQARDQNRVAVSSATDGSPGLYPPLSLLVSFWFCCCSIHSVPRSLAHSLRPSVPPSILSFSASRLLCSCAPPVLCFSGPLLLCLSASPLLCSSAPLLPCFSAPLLLRFSAPVLLCYFASLLLRSSAPLLL